MIMRLDDDEKGQRGRNVFVLVIHLQPVQQMFLSCLFNLFHTSSSCCCAGREINNVYFIEKYPR